MNVNVITAVNGDIGTVSVEGEVDVSNADTLREGVLGLIADEAVKTVEVDLAGVPYIDSTGIGVLVGAAHRAEDAGKALRVLRAQDNVSRIFGMLGVDEIIG
ncbi:MAG: STAS domain-containing protein [Coriobacteriia bacterium]|nr:STAS domain-containing protein [Coriobacteriia bacterium]MBS5477280.1 STAS domain-containing protein [Coriobacteriia bacterium]